MNATDDPIGSAVTLPDRWPTEISLLIFTVLAAAGMWALIAVTIIGAVYAVLIAAVLFLARVGFVTHLRGSAVRLGERQLPELHARVRELAGRAGLKRMPEVYLLQSGGELNALAARFFRAPMMVLFLSLLEACGEEEAARDTVIAHELAHIRAGHLRFAWLLAPGMLLPFPGLAYSRARELTCDRWAAAITGDCAGALRGLAVLAAGGAYSRRLDIPGLAAQRRDLDTGWMTLGTWLSTHPPLCRRLEALDGTLTTGISLSLRGPIRAIALLVVLLGIPAGAGAFWAARALPAFQRVMQEAQQQAATQQGRASTAKARPIVDEKAALAKASAQLNVLAAMLDEFRQRNGAVPADSDGLYGAWRTLRADQEEPVDPFDGGQYGYESAEGGYRLWSSGPDGKSGTDDDIVRVGFPAAAGAKARKELQELFDFAEGFARRNSVAPADTEALYGAWRGLRPDRAEPHDPFNQELFRYEAKNRDFRLWSVGPDGIDGSPDDVVLRSAAPHT
ncbi:MAG: M48 family metalloprotease [Acidobacteriota bacterium]